MDSGGNKTEKLDVRQMLVKAVVILALVERLFLNNSASNDGDLIRSSLTFDERTRGDTMKAGRKMRNNEMGKIVEIERFAAPRQFSSSVIFHV